jgi:hypothetical protein
LLRFTMLQGSASIERVIVTQVVNNEVYQGSFSIPEPSSWSLLLASVCLLLKKGARSNHSLQRTLHGVVVCKRCVPRAGSLSLGR